MAPLAGRLVKESMAQWPNFFIVGAPKAATTTLFEWLRSNPDIYCPVVKEPYFFATLAPELLRWVKLGLGYVRKEEDYLQLFAGAGTRVAIGEASTTYLYDKDAPLRIKVKVPGAKIIILLREPIDRAYSHYLMLIWSGHERKPFYQALLADYANPRKIQGAAHLYVEAGLYYEQVKRYLDTFGPEQVRVYLYDDLVADAAPVVKDVCAFLGVPFYEGRFFNPNESFNAHQAPRNVLCSWIIGIMMKPFILFSAAALIPKPVRWPVLHRLKRWSDRLLLAPRPKPPMDERARHFLRPLYLEDIRKLQGLINRDLSHWLA